MRRCAGLHNPGAEAHVLSVNAKEILEPSIWTEEGLTVLLQIVLAKLS
jgi:hypothetical protein